MIGVEDLPAEQIERLGPTGSLRIDALVRDIVARSREAGDIVQSEEMGGAMLRLRKFMFDRVYLGAAARSEEERVDLALTTLLDHYLQHPDEIPGEGQASDPLQRVTDYIAGMTDRFCIATFRRIALPEESRLCTIPQSRGGTVDRRHSRMSRFTPETIERVREAANIVEIVSAHTDLRKQGVRFVGLCPFHDERTPSFSVKPDEGFYYCFGCEAGGDTIRFVQEKEGLAFPDAVESLAERYGVEIEVEREDPKAEEARRRRGRLERGAPAGVGLLRVVPLGVGRRRRSARTYLTEERGLGEEVLRSFGVGFAPSVWDSILTRGQRAGFSVQELHDAGLIQRSQNRPGSHYDRFRGTDHVPGAGPPRSGGRLRRSRDGRRREAEVPELARGRALPQEPHPLRDRPGAGADRARRPRGRGRGLHRRARPASGGDRGGRGGDGDGDHARSARSCSAGYAEEVVLALDADRAGREAMLRAQRVPAASKLRLLVAAMPAGRGPGRHDAHRGGRRAAAEGAGGARSTSPSSTCGRSSATPTCRRPTGRDRALDEVVPVLVAMGETITRQEMVREVADRLDADPDLVTGRMRGGTPTPARAGAASERAAERPRRRRLTPDERRQASLLALCIAAPEGGARVPGAARPRALHLAGADARCSSGSASIWRIHWPA